MATAHANGIDIEYEILGDPAGLPLLLIMGLGAQLIGWDDDLCSLLGSRGYRVIRFDNRDIGLSTKLDAAGLPNMMDVVGRLVGGGRIDAPYSISDMADDAAALLDALEVHEAHVVGASMGGMIAQSLAIRHPDQVLSLTSIMANTGELAAARPTPDALGLLFSPTPSSREANIERAVDAARVLAGGGFPVDEERVRSGAARAYDRCFYPPGSARQLLAILASDSRREALRAVKVPSLIIHGTADPLIPVQAGIDTHRAIPGSQLLLIDGMGHELPAGIWPTSGYRAAPGARRRGRGSGPPAPRRPRGGRTSG